MRVVDFTQALSGPYCTLMLADLGADVIKVEPPGRGDDARHWGPPFLGEDSTYFLSVNRNKRSICLNLKDPADLASVLALIATADVVVENWRPGTAERLGIGYDQVRQKNEQIIYCSIVAFGPVDDGRAGYDQIVQGTSGAMSLTGRVGDPTKSGVPIADVGAGMFAATAIAAALHARLRDGRGRHIEISMEDSMLAMMSNHATRQLAVPTRIESDHNGHATIAPYGLFQTADGHVNICVGNDGQFARLCSALVMPEASVDSRFATNKQRIAHKEAVLAAVARRVQAMSTGEVVDLLRAIGVPVGPVRSLDEATRDAEIRARGSIVTIGRSDFESAEVINGPWRINGERPHVRRSPPFLGEHTVEVLQELGPAGR